MKSVELGFKRDWRLWWGNTNSVSSILRCGRTLELREHFGNCEHSQGHWIDLDMTWQFPLWQLLRERPAVAHPQCRDIAPLRLVSWRLGLSIKAEGNAVQTDDSFGEHIEESCNRGLDHADRN